MIYLHYLFTHIRKTTKFDEHIKRLKENNDKVKIYIAYGNKICFFLATTSLGILMLDYFETIYAFPLFFVSFILFVILAYFDNKN